jgi:hypothetical protein
LSRPMAAGPGPAPRVCSARPPLCKESRRLRSNGRTSKEPFPCRHES